ncbi:hypothetical protein GCM10022249_19980 [Enteractinococcus coprophilus]
MRIERLAMLDYFNTDLVSRISFIVASFACRCRLIAGAKAIRNTKPPPKAGVSCAPSGSLGLQR